MQFNTAILNNYYGLLNNLDSESKLELIIKLSNSLMKKNKKNNLDVLFGAFKTKKSADEIISDIKNSRNFKRKTIAL